MSRFTQLLEKHGIPPDSHLGKRLGAIGQFCTASFLVYFDENPWVRSNESALSHARTMAQHGMTTHCDQIGGLSSDFVDEFVRFVLDLTFTSEAGGAE